MPVSMSPGTSMAPIAARPAWAPDCQSLAFEPVPYAPWQVGTLKY